MTDAEWEVIGTVDVDSGMLLLIDSCLLDSSYVAHEERYENELLPIAGRTGRYGMGVATASGFGDGTYEVEARWMVDELGHRRVAEVRVQFIDPSG